MPGVSSAARAKFGAVVRRLREEAGMTQRELAERLQTSVPFVCDVEHGKRSTRRVAAFERALGVVGGTLASLTGVCKACNGTGLAGSSDA